MNFESLTVKLKDGSTYYFPAGPVTDDPSPRVDNLRFAIDNGATFRSVDESGEMREFNGADVHNYHLA
ncbi:MULTISPECIES: hypothetical protein [Corynebacterium]|jgi:hypothetical protein|uniref:Uncharacterized protein n=1 Tax=Corynebacterium accolens TaxID=38284 RepID=A0ABT7FS16_9CORY|nr:MULTISPECIES: hypothetical protein [Corynebacterium]ERS43166.1 hypothetical protein HMPREF1293_00105 [Corynebacterium sp. KPL1996]ERS45212.1 hypothetical protein HMPREF1287_01727 [Corynebacterium sp. KPL1986]ERS73745.1 hypothetical protein HMPREF1295_00719 [Corynebacterium sp. KPL1998]ERS76051.1 hypothetical protein HMPREF1300_00104 [Corynebacterium sp. KPL2004]MCT1410170.1 hypothetical protein [Corynebacterium accolens]